MIYLKKRVSTLKSVNPMEYKAPLTPDIFEFASFNPNEPVFLYLTKCLSDKFQPFNYTSPLERDASQFTLLLLKTWLDNVAQELNRPTPLENLSAKLKMISKSEMHFFYNTCLDFSLLQKQIRQNILDLTSKNLLPRYFDKFYSLYAQFDLKNVIFDYFNIIRLHASDLKTLTQFLVERTNIIQSSYMTLISSFITSDSDKQGLTALGSVVSKAKTTTTNLSTAPDKDITLDFLSRLSENITALHQLFLNHDSLILMGTMALKYRSAPLLKVLNQYLQEHRFEHLSPIYCAKDAGLREDEQYFNTISSICQFHSSRTQHSISDKTEVLSLSIEQKRAYQSLLSEENKKREALHLEKLYPNSDTRIGPFSMGVVSLINECSYMEDFWSYKTGTIHDTNVSIFSVFDGHGGTATVTEAKNHFNNLIVKELHQLTPVDLLSPYSVSKIITNVCIAFDNYLILTHTDTLDKTTLRGGTTVISGLIIGSHLYTINIGDSCGYIVTKEDLLIPLSYSHSPGMKEEKKRIRSLGGKIKKVENESVVSGTDKDGRITMTRSIGDPSLTSRHFNPVTVKEKALKSTFALGPDILDIEETASTLHERVLSSDVLTQDESKTLSARLKELIASRFPADQTIKKQDLQTVIEELFSESKDADKKAAILKELKQQFDKYKQSIREKKRLSQFNPDFKLMNPTPFISIFPFKSGDRLYLSTDGVLPLIPNHELEIILKERQENPNNPLTAMAHHVCKYANIQKYAGDNMTIMVVE